MSDARGRLARIPDLVDSLPFVAELSRSEMSAGDRGLRQDGPTRRHFPGTTKTSEEGGPDMNSDVIVETSVREFIHGPEVTWVGPNPFEGGSSILVGFDDGSIESSDLDKARRPKPPMVMPVSQAKEAINGIATIGKNSWAVSTRSEVTFVEFESSTKDKGSRTEFSGGAHGVISTQSGYFIAPLGMRGLLIVKPDANSKQVFNVITNTKNNLYCYRIAALRDTAGTEVLELPTGKTALA